MNVPFSFYDVLGYLASGFLAIAGSKYLFNMDIIVGRNPNVFELPALVLACYVLGHLLTELVQVSLGHRVIEKVLGAPAMLLLGIGEKRWLGKLFVSYSTPLSSSSLREEILSSVRSKGVDVDKGDLFPHMVLIARQDESTLARMNRYLTLYNFSRNVFFVGSILSAMYLFIGISTGNGTNVLIGAIFAVAAAGMFTRYLRFYRLYGLEVILGYRSHLKDEADTSG